MNKNDLIERTRKFAIRVFKLVDLLPKSKATDVISYQLLKSASSVAANYRASARAKSRVDFSNKIKTVLEEADESNFWLTFIKDLELLIKNKELNELIQESSELTAIFTTSVKTLSNS
ncbi:MAG: four helix bundle protein [Bacteroidetes bacterium]|nr:four helix bundle protein [Bacteroidota bacterium]